MYYKRNSYVRIKIWNLTSSFKRNSISFLFLIGPIPPIQIVLTLENKGDHNIVIGLITTFTINSGPVRLLHSVINSECYILMCWAIHLNENK